MAMPFDDLCVEVDRDGGGQIARRRLPVGRLLKRYTETRTCHFCGQPGHLSQSCREKQIFNEIGKDAKDGKEAKDDEQLAQILKDSADPLPLSHGHGTVRWQGVAV